MPAQPPPVQAHVRKPVIAGISASAARPKTAAPAGWLQSRADNSRQVHSATNVVTTGIVAGLAVTNVVQFAVLMAASAISAAPPGPFTTTPTLRLNGFDIVPASVAEVSSVYGRWAYLPGTPGLIQGRQTFAVVDPKTGVQAGTFDALVGRGNGIGYTQLLVTSTDAVAAGVPPVGSLISNFQFGPVGLSFSSVPTGAGNAVSLKLTTPRRDIRLPFAFDNAKGIADRTVDNRPMQLGNGYSIAPADPVGEKLTGITGLLPGFMTVQGNQTFTINDAAGHPVGSFEGIFTTTADLFFYTQAVIVTANDGTNVGAGPGQVPPVGSVFNVIYFGSDDRFLLYSALPAPGGADVSVIRVTRGKVTASALTLIDATDPPAVELAGAGGFRFVPASEFRPSGVNGLPPREIQLQGYQQFDVYDETGARIGTVEASVFKQWDGFDIRSTSLMITGVREGGDDVPPAGSIFNFVRSGAGGFGSAHATVAGPSGNLTSFTLLTPLGDIRFPSRFVDVAHRTPVVFSSL